MVRKDDTRQVDSIARKLKLSREQRRLLHDEIHGRSLTYREILEEAEQILRDHPERWARQE
jgi:hypothetical protein